MADYMYMVLWEDLLIEATMILFRHGTQSTLINPL